MDTHLILDLVCEEPFSSWPSLVLFDGLVDDGDDDGDWKYAVKIDASVVFSGLLTGISFGILMYS